MRFLTAGPEDAEAMAAMALDIWRRCHRPDVLTDEEIEYFWHVGYRPETLREEMQRGAVYEWIAAEGGKIGFLAYCLEADRNRLHLGKLYLRPEYHGRGIGVEALERLKTVAAGLGVEEIYLYVFRKNVPAVHAYLRAGFVVERAEVIECGNGCCFDDLVMRWRAEPG